MALTVTSAPWSQVAMPALDLRRLLSFGLSEGVNGTTDVQVAQRAAGANMSVDIAAGQAVIQGDAVANQGLYYVYNDAVFNLTGFTAAHATLPRVDRVTLRVRDAFHGDAANDISLQILSGTATSGANLTNLTGAASVPGSQLLLANILVPATATSITTANISDQRTTAGQATAPPGSIITYGGATAPTGYLLCDGAAVSRTSYSALFGIVGTNYGVGDGSTTFNVPDYRDRFPVGAGTTYARGATGGEATHALTTGELAAHNHTISLTGSPALSGSPALTGSPSLSGAPSLSGTPGITDPGHTHTNYTGNDGGSGNQEGNPANTGTGRTTRSSTTGITATIGTLAGTIGSLAGTIGSLASGIGSLASGIGSLAGSSTNTGSGTAHENRPPYLAAFFLIKT